LDGLGETMSKSKGNGVDPNDENDKFGHDALRFGLARLAGDTQDVRMPVQYECPACEKLIDQTKKNRSLPKLDCPACGKAFSTQWAESEEDKALPKGAVVSERFETARNFVNKLWNASRYVQMNLEGFTPQPIDVSTLPIEDKWLLSRLASVTQQVSDGIDRYQYSDIAAILYNFAWDEFCSFYVEIAKPRLSDPEQKVVTQNVIAHGLDQLLRLLHPIMPFVTESVWGYLGELAPTRGVPEPAEAGKFAMTSAWPDAQSHHHDVQIERQFSEFQQIVGAIRQIRASQNIKPSDTVPVAIRCDQSSRELLEPMTAYFQGLASADVVAIGPDVEPFETDAHIKLTEVNVDVHIDLDKFIDTEAELARLQKAAEKTKGQITGKENKLNNESFVSRAPKEIVDKERESLATLREQLATILKDIARLEAKKS
ncbi:MAG: class I tRNA ligase family protein, partial [Rhodopirellula sp. JB053]